MSTLAPVRPTPIAAELRKRRSELEKIVAKHGAKELRVFGSVARGEERAKSDIDLLVTFRSGSSLLDLVALQQELARKLRRSVDVVPRGGLSPHLRRKILRESRPL